MKANIDCSVILKMLPHRYPFLLIDKVTEIEPGESAIGIKNVTINEPYFQGHFPGEPIVPGVLLLESLAQLTAVMYGAEALPADTDWGKISAKDFEGLDLAGINAMLRVMSGNGFDNYKPEKYYWNDQEWGYKTLHDIDYYAPRYTHRNHAKVYSISEDEYYYLKVLNARGPDSYFDFNEDMSLTGDVKLPSNVSGGTGNIFLSSRIEISGSLYEDYVPEYGGEEFPYYYVDEEE